VSTSIIKSKNLSPQQLAALAALAIALPTGIGFYWVNAGCATTLIFPALLWTASYFLILYLVQQFIYRKIKLIYKLIYQTKASKREEFYYNNILPMKSIDEVQEDVENAQDFNDGSIFPTSATHSAL
jgi:two-component system phosphate regulon sensor histidine kinase PhoR